MYVISGINEKKELLNFTDFIAILWNFLSMDEGQLPRLVYYLFDDDHNDSLDFREIKQVVECIHQKKYDTSSNIRMMVDDMQYSYAQISTELFSKFCRKNHNICSPILSVQFNMRKTIKGDLFWNKIANKRILDKEKCKPDFVYKCLQKCEVLREDIARNKKLAAFSEMKKTMLSEKKNKEQKALEASTSKFDKLKKKKDAEVKARKANRPGIETVVIEKSLGGTPEESSGKNTESDTADVDSGKSEKTVPTMKGSAMVVLAAKRFKDGVKISPKIEVAGDPIDNKLQRSNSKVKISRGGGGSSRSLVRGVSSVHLLENDGDKGQNLKRQNSKKKKREGDGGGNPLQRRSSSKRLINADEDGHNNGSEKLLKRKSSRKLGVDNGDTTTGRAGSVLKRQTSRKLAANTINIMDVDGRNVLDVDGRSPKRQLRRSSSKISEKMLLEGGGGGRRKLEPLNLSATKKKKLKSAKSN